MRSAVFACALVIVAAACGRPGDTLPSPTASAPTSPAVTTTTPERLPGSPTPAGLTEALVVSVVDGDTIDVLVGGQVLRVRYIGIDTPETVDPRRPVECFGREASERNREIVEGKAVRLEKDVSELDRYGRVLRYVWVDGAMVNATLVEEGYATATTYPPDVRYADLFASLQEQAREVGRGLWRACPAGQTATPQPP